MSFTFTAESLQQAGPRRHRPNALQRESVAALAGGALAAGALMLAPAAVAFASPLSGPAASGGACAPGAAGCATHQATPLLLGSAAFMPTRLAAASTSS